MRNVSLLPAVVICLWIASTAQALSIDPGNSGLDQASGCEDVSCLTTLYTLSASAPISGEIDITGSTLSFDIDLPAATLIALNGGDGLVTSLDLFDVRYLGNISVTLDASNNYLVDLGQVATVSGTVSPNGAGSPTLFSGSNVLVTGLCSGTPGNTLQCGLIFGPLLDFTASVNGNTRYFSNSIDALAAIPEPGTATLLGLGLAFLAVPKSAYARNRADENSDETTRSC